MPNKFKINKKALILRILLIFLLFGVVLNFILIPSVLNSPKYKNQIETGIEKSLGLPVSIGNINAFIALNLGLKINIEKITIYHANCTNFVSAKDAFVEISLPALLQKKVFIKNINIKNLRFNIVRSSYGKFDTQQFFAKRGKTPKYKIVFQNAAINVDNYKVCFMDKFVYPNQNYLVFGKNIKISDFDPEKFIKVKAEGNIYQENRPSSNFNLNYSSALPFNTNQINCNNIIFDGNIKNFYPDMYLAYFNKYSPYKFAYLSGNIEKAYFKIKTENGEDFPVNFLMNTKLKDFEAKKVDDKAQFNFSGTTKIFLDAIKTTKNLNIKELNIDSEKIKTNLSGNIADISSKSPKLDLNLNINKSKLLYLIYLIPKEIYVPNNIISKLRKYNADGDLHANMNILGNTKTPELFGHLTLENISMISNVKTIPYGNGTIDFLGKIYNLNFLFSIAKGELVRVSGNVSPVYKKFNLRIKSNTGNLGKFQQILFAVRDILNFKLSFFSNLTAEGRGNVDINIFGSFKYPLTKGFVDIINARAAYTGFSQTLKDLKGKVYFEGRKIYFNNLTGKIANSHLTAKGWVNRNKLDIILSSKKLDLSETRKLIIDSPILNRVEEAISLFSSMSGYAETNLRLTGNINGNIFNNLKLKTLGASLTAKQLGFPVKIIEGRVLINSKGVYTNGVQSEILNSPARITGRITGFGAKITPNVKIILPRTDFNKIKTLANAPIVPKNMKKIVSKFKNLKGNFNATINFLPNDYKAILKLNKISAGYIPQNLPVSINSGTIKLNSKEIIFKTLKGTVADSPYFINGTVKNYKTSPVLNILASAKVNSEDIREYLNPHLKEDITAKGIFPAEALLKGHINNWQLDAKIIANKGDYIHIKHDIGLPLETVRVLNLKANGSLKRNSEKIIFKNLEVIAGDTSVLTATGEIKRLNSKPYFSNLIIDIYNPLSVKIFNPAFADGKKEPFFADGFITGKASFNGKFSSPEVIGSAELNNIIIPSKHTTIKNAVLDFTQNAFILKDSSINIADSEIKITAEADKKLSLPFTVRKVDITASLFDLSGIIDALKPDSGSTKKIEKSPVLINQGSLKANELILNKLITTNFFTNFSLNEDSLLNLPNIAFDSANGSAKGQTGYNITTSDLFGKVSATGMNANAAATTFLNIPNEVYGKLNGDLEFRTKGTKSEEIMSNANGSVKFKISDGRLVRLGSIEHLLLAANTVLAGVGNINANKILNIVVPEKTGYFSVLSGTITAKNGVLSTDNMRSKGKNLSLLIKGNLKLSDRNADITIFGRLSKKVAGRLGILGDLSINTAIEAVPILGYLPDTPEEQGLIGSIPLLDQIPLLGFGKNKRFRVFVVRIVGNLYDPSSVKSFRWLNK